MVEEIKKTVKKLNWYRVEDILAVTAISSFIATLFCKTNKEIAAIICGSSAIIWGIVFMLLFAPATTVLKNNSSRKIKALSEDGGEIIEIDPGTEATGIDGVKVNGVVYKLNNGIHAKIDKEDKITIKTIFGNIINRSSGFMLNEASDEKWQKLFDAE